MNLHSRGQATMSNWGDSEGLMAYRVRGRRPHGLTLRRSGSAGGAPRRRRGFTIVELIVAMMIFSVGLLAMASTSARVITMLSSGQARTVAASVAENRFERLRGVSCSAHRTDSTTTRGIKEVWTVVPLTRSDDVTVVLRFSADHGTKSQVYRTFIPCL